MYNNTLFVSWLYIMWCGRLGYRLVKLTLAKLDLKIYTIRDLYRSRYAEWRLYIFLNSQQCSDMSACFQCMVLLNFDKRVDLTVIIIMFLMAILFPGLVVDILKTYTIKFCFVLLSTYLYIQSYLSYDSHKWSRTAPLNWKLPKSHSAEEDTTDSRNFLFDQSE